MRITPAFLIAATFATTLSAQRPRQLPLRSARSTDDSPIQQTLTFDVAAAFQQRYRAATEALVFGRFTIGLSGEYTTQPGDQPVYYPVPYAVPSCPIDVLCSGSSYSADGPQYRAWSFNVHGRWYPRALSYSGERQSVSAYVGEFVGYHERRIKQPIYYGCPYCTAPPPRDSVVFVDTTVTYPPVPYPGGSSFTQILHGWEPGAEFGVRVSPAKHIVIDVGGTLRIETLQDPQSGTRPGGLVKQLMVAVGVGW